MTYWSCAVSGVLTERGKKKFVWIREDSYRSHLISQQKWEMKPYGKETTDGCDWIRRVKFHERPPQKKQLVSIYTCGWCVASHPVFRKSSCRFQSDEGGVKVWRQTHFFQKIDLLFQLKELFIPVTNHHFKEITSENVCDTKPLAFAINTLHLQSHVMV